MTTTNTDKPEQSPESKLETGQIKQAKAQNRTTSKTAKPDQAEQLSSPADEISAPDLDRTMDLRPEDYPVGGDKTIALPALKRGQHKPKKATAVQTDAVADDDKTVLRPATPRPSHASEAPSPEQPSAAQDAKNTIIGSPASAHRNTQSTQQRQTTLQQHQIGDQESTPIGPGGVLKGRYDLFEKLGSGGMGEVYKALDRRDVEAGNTIFIAIKVLNEEFRANPDVLRALHSEARKTQQLAHPNIITVYDFDRDGDAVFMTMEYIGGATLNYLIKSNPNGLKVNEALGIIDQLGNALSYAHSNLVIHSDLKPGNIFIDRANHVKVLDFGIARLASLTQFSRFDAGILGALTPAYASLEMLQGDMPDPRDDIYAFACVIYELFTGKHPFNRNDARRAKYNNQKPKEIKVLNRKQWQALKKALAFDREHRTPSVEELIRGLHSRDYNWLYGVALLGIVALVVLLQVTGVVSLLPEQQTQTKQETQLVKPPPQPIAPVAVATIDPAKSPAAVSLARPQNKVPKDIKKPPVIPVPGKIKLWSAKKQYRIGDNMSIGFTVNKPLYVRVALINPDGEVIELFPNPYQENNLCKPGNNYHIPPKGSDLELTIFGPAGTDRIRAIGREKQFSFADLKFSKEGKLINGYTNTTIIGEVDYVIK